MLGFWNALIGLWLLHFRKDAWGEVAPYAAAGDDRAPLHIRTAIFMTVRNEDPARAILRLRTVKDSVDATGEGGAFRYFVLSDTSDLAVAAAEEAAVVAWKASDPDASASSTAAAPTTSASRRATSATSAPAGARTTP